MLFASNYKKKRRVREGQEKRDRKCTTKGKPLLLSFDQSRNSRPLRKRVRESVRDRNETQTTEQEQLIERKRQRESVCVCVKERE